MTTDSLGIQRVTALTHPSDFLANFSALLLLLTLKTLPWLRPRATA